MKKARLLPLFFQETNERELGEMQEQMVHLNEHYADVAEFLEPVMVGQPMPEADALVFPKMIFAAFRCDNFFKSLKLPIFIAPFWKDSLLSWRACFAALTRCTRSMRAASSS